MCLRAVSRGIVIAASWVFNKAVEMVSDADTGRISHTKLATATGHLVGTYWFCALNARDPFDLDLWIVYFCVVVGHHQVNKLQDVVAAIKGVKDPKHESE